MPICAVESDGRSVTFSPIFLHYTSLVYGLLYIRLRVWQA